MRHRKINKIFGREKAARKSLYKSLAESIILYEKIQTTETKAKAIRSYVEKAITIGKESTLSTRRKLLRTFHTELPVKKILDVLGPRYKERSGGYTRIIKLGHRFNDGAEMVRIELV